MIQVWPSRRLVAVLRLKNPVCSNNLSLNSDLSGSRTKVKEPSLLYLLINEGSKYGFMPFSRALVQKMKCKQLCPGFKLASLCSFSKTINVTPRTSQLKFRSYRRRGILTRWATDLTICCRRSNSSITYFDAGMQNNGHMIKQYTCQLVAKLILKKSKKLGAGWGCAT